MIVRVDETLNFSDKREHIMKIIIKKIFIILRSFFEYIKWLYQYIKNPKTKKIKNEGKVVICGNGPSIKLFPFSEFIDRGYKTCVVNYFPTDEELFFKIKPSFYVCVDPFFHSSIDELTDEEIKLVNSLNKVSWNMKYICYKKHHLPLNNPNISYSYINKNFFSYDYSKLIKNLLDNNKATFGYQNVIIAAIYYFIMSEVDEVVLTGVENDWHRELVVDQNNDVFREMTHFYGNEKINVTELGEIKKGELFNYFKFYYLTLYQYYLLSKYAEDSKTKVVNSTVNSYIDVFSKMNPQEILHKSL